MRGVVSVNQEIFLWGSPITTEVVLPKNILLTYQYLVEGNAACSNDLENKTFLYAGFFL